MPNDVWGKIFASIIAIVLISTLALSGAFVLIVNILLWVILVAALIYIWTR